jgi:post-segregation antitoxin (ccd killing protein)
MPKINVYLPDALASAVKDAEVPVSAVCQAALSDAVERIGRTRRGVAALRDAATPPAILQRIGEAPASG